MLDLRLFYDRRELIHYHQVRGNETARHGLSSAIEWITRGSMRGRVSAAAALDLRPIDGMPDVEEGYFFVNCLRVFLRSACIKDDDSLPRPNVAAREKCLERRKANRSLGADRQAFECDRLSHPWLDGAFGHCDSRSAACPNRVEYHEVPNRRGYADTAGDGRRVLEFLGEPLTPIKRPRDGCASLTLARDHSWLARRLQPAQVLELGERLPHADEPRASASRIQNDVRQLPIELFRQFQTHGFLAFDSIRLLQRGQIKPTFFRLPVPDDSAAVIDEAIDVKCLRARQPALLGVDGRGVLRHEYVGLHAGAGGVGRHRPSGVAGGGRGHSTDPEIPGLGDGHRHTARLEAAGR